MKRNKIIVCLTAMLCLSSIVTGCSEKNKETGTTTEIQNENKQEQTSGIALENEDDINNLVEEEKALMEKDSEFKLTVSEAQGDISFGTPWKVSESGKTCIAIEGRGPEAIEEGIGFIYLNDGDKIECLSFEGSASDKAPKYVEWISEEEFIFYSVNRYGRVFTGGSLYVVNINDMQPILLYKAMDDEEILEATKINADTINMKILKHNSEAIVSTEKNLNIK